MRRRGRASKSLEGRVVVRAHLVGEAEGVAALESAAVVALEPARDADIAGLARRSVVDGGRVRDDERAVGDGRDRRKGQGRHEGGGGGGAFARWAPEPEGRLPGRLRVSRARVLPREAPRILSVRAARDRQRAVDVRERRVKNPDLDDGERGIRVRLGLRLVERARRDLGGETGDFFSRL